MASLSRVVLPVALVALLCTATSQARAPYYWTTAQANAAVVAQAKIPYCKVGGFACTNGVPNDITQKGAMVTPEVSTCSGAPGFTSHGLFSRFVCKWQGNNQVGYGTLTVLTAGPKTIRWSSLTA